MLEFRDVVGAGIRQKALPEARWPGMMVSTIFNSLDNSSLVGDTCDAWDDLQTGDNPNPAQSFNEKLQGFSCQTIF